MHPMLNIAVRAARAAGNLIARNIGQQGQFSVEEKKKDDLVTDIDRECERTIIQILQKSYRDHAFLAEESGLSGNSESEYVWVIDPIDGTTNFVQGIAHCAVSIGLRHNGKPEVAVVFDPFLNEMFTAARGEGAMLNGHRIRVGTRTSLDGAVIGTAFPVRFRERMDAYLKLFGNLLDKCADVRRMGSASLDLCYVACGRFDGFLEQGLKPWDYAAGELIIREAGGLVTDFTGTPNYTKTGNIVTANPNVVRSMLAVCDPQNIASVLR